MASCPHCSEPLVDASAPFCPHCGRQLASAAPLSTQPAETSGKAVASLIFGLPFFFVVVSIVAIILGHMAKKDIRQSGGRLKGTGFATAGLVLGYSGVALFLLVMAAAVVMVPRYMQALVRTREAAAISRLQTLSAGVTMYSTTYGNGYPPSLAALGPAPGDANQQTCDHADLIDSRLASGSPGGYTITYAGSNPLPHPGKDCSAVGYSAFTIHADPIPRATGQRSFFMDASGTIHYNLTQPATATDPVWSGN